MRNEKVYPIIHGVLQDDEYAYVYKLSAQNPFYRIIY